VTDPPPHYSLRDVQDLAKAGAVVFHRNAGRDRENLGIGFQQAVDRIACLEIGEFRESKEWGTLGIADDYLAEMQCPQFGDRRKVYVKLKLYKREDGSIGVYVASFHTQKPLPP
jgi:hypothetical protein